MSSRITKILKIIKMEDPGIMSLEAFVCMVLSFLKNREPVYINSLKSVRFCKIHR